MVSRLIAGLKIAGINLLAPGGGLLAIETVLWWRDESQVADQWRFEIDPVMGHAHSPATFAYSTNAARSISPSRHFTLEQYPAPSSSEPLRILTLDGSTTDTLRERFSGDDSTWPAYFGRALQSRGRSVEIANGGVGSFASSQELLKLISVLSWHAPGGGVTSPIYERRSSSRKRCARFSIVQRTSGSATSGRLMQSPKPTVLGKSSCCSRPWASVWTAPRP